MSVLEPIKTSRSRLLYLDWLRGAAAVIMLQGHVFHSFVKDGLRDGGPYVLSQFVGGMPPAIFLFLTGITLAFLMDSGERKSVPAGARVIAALRRAGYLFAIAFLFRLQLWLFAWPDSPWTDLLKVDILNCMGFAIVVVSALAVFTTAQRVRYAAALGVAVAAASPLVSSISWGGVPQLVRSYVAPDYNHFGFFPWGAYLVFGLSAGSLIRVLRREHMERAMQWCALVGIGLALSAYYASSLPYSVYTKSEFWLDSPAQVLIKLGVILAALPLAFLWTEYGARPGWSWVRQLGTTSLLVYWVHIELVYGRWLWFLKNKLDVSQTVLAAVALILFMLLLAAAKTYRNWWIPALRDFFRLSPTPARVPGD